MKTYQIVNQEDKQPLTLNGVTTYSDKEKVEAVFDTLTINQQLECQIWISIEVKLEEKEDRFLIVDEDNNSYSNCARKGDAKKILKKYKHGTLILVEEFKVVKKPKSPKKVKSTSYISKYDTYLDWILKNVKEDQLHSKSDKLKAFAKHFEVQFMEKYNRCRPFEETLKYMVKQNTIEKLPGKRAIYKLIEEEL